ncbi:unnamed protein product [Prorocentrum cordatum]|uniref:Uncharacterized protein n=1 Tax=Prorocentrum cordatum TaxID=2364126 RepID=A0ABN9XSM9_9DINO|nr:unnamed protein product [Polarella glacialis]
MMPTCMRRELIRERRGFDCACERCELGEDALRRRRCHLCGEVALGPAEPRLERAASLCRSCGARGGAEGGEDEVLLARQAAKLRVSSGADAAVQLHARCMEQLGETHWATARCCCMLLLALAEQSAEAEADAARARSLYDFQKFLRACELTEAVPNLHHILTIHLWQSGLLDVQVCRDILPLYQAIHGRNPTAVGIADALGKSMSPIQRLKCSDGYFAQLALLLRSRMPGSSGMVFGGCATAFAIGLAVAVHARRSAPAYSLPRPPATAGSPRESSNSMTSAAEKPAEEARLRTGPRTGRGGAAGRRGGRGDGAHQHGGLRLRSSKTTWKRCCQTLCSATR